MGEKVMIDEFVSIKYPERMKIGENSFIGRGSMVQASGGVEIGQDVIIGPFVKIWCSDHVFKKIDKPINLQGHTFGKVTVDDDVWMGTGVIVLKGVRIGKGAVVAAGSVITKDVPGYAIVAGNPVRIIRYRGEAEVAHE
mgnify:CR=1 FL=1